MTLGPKYVPGHMLLKARGHVDVRQGVLPMLQGREGPLAAGRKHATSRLPKQLKIQHGGLH